MRYTRYLNNNNDKVVKGAHTNCNNQNKYNTY